MGGGTSLVHPLFVTVQKSLSGRDPQAAVEDQISRETDRPASRFFLLNPFNIKAKQYSLLRRDLS